MKPRYKLRLDGSLLPIRDRLTEAVRRLQSVSDAPFESPFKGMTYQKRLSSSAEARFQRQVIRAFGSQTAFLEASGLKQAALWDALRKSNFSTLNQRPAILRQKLGLPVQLGDRA